MFPETPNRPEPAAGHRIVEATGTSMRPHLRSGDLFLLEAEPRGLLQGDLVLIRCDGEHRLHRVLGDGSIKGDRCVERDEGTSVELVGRAVARLRRRADGSTLEIRYDRPVARWLNGLLARLSARNLRGRKARLVASRLGFVVGLVARALEDRFPS